MPKLIVFYRYFNHHIAKNVFGILIAKENYQILEIKAPF